MLIGVSLIGGSADFIFWFCWLMSCNGGREAKSKLASWYFDGDGVLYVCYLDGDGVLYDYLLYL